MLFLLVWLIWLIWLVSVAYLGYLCAPVSALAVFTNSASAPGRRTCSRIAPSNSRIILNAGFATSHITGDGAVRAKTQGIRPANRRTSLSRSSRELRLFCFWPEADETIHLSTAYLGHGSVRPWPWPETTCAWMQDLISPHLRSPYVHTTVVVQTRYEGIIPLPTNITSGWEVRSKFNSIFGVVRFNSTSLEIQSSSHCMSLAPPSQHTIPVT